ncbi:MAG TPA: hypothetical protein VFQ88_07605 [Nevskiaceae bacterium]|nr:hypothetical protein [Nevskiaceae bacterium]
MPTNTPSILTLDQLTRRCDEGGSVADFEPSVVADAVVNGLLPVSGNAGAAYYRRAAHIAVRYVCTAMREAPRYRFVVADIFAPETQQRLQATLDQLAAGSAEFANAQNGMGVTLRVLGARRSTRPLNKAA